jgi:hypothetical protein
VLHQCPTEELFRPGTKGMRPGKVVLLGSLCLDVTSVVFHAHPPKGTVKHLQSILPCGDDSFPAFQLPLPGEDLLPLLNSHHRC